MLKSLLIILLLTYAGLALIALLLADRLIFLPPASSYAPGELPIVQVPGEGDERIAALYLPLEGAELTLIYSHGNAEDVGHLAGLMERIRDEAGVSVLAYDYRGYGLSTGGPPTAAGATRDLEDVYRYAVEELGIAADRLIVHGRSVGAGPALELAARHPVGGVIVESSFVSAFRVMTRIPLLPFDRFPNLRNMREVSAPVLVIHGLRDEVIPASHGRRLFAAAPEPKRQLWVEAAGHNDLVHTAGAAYWQALREMARLVESRLVE
ncbi:MAG: alpha/beta hydrolase [Gemmatimonadetes bacterium]|nr:alpha/beta hydrolase [Gemmatimonadota bacterium]